ncbi:polymer-forming cytoskeletal protein [Thauera sp. CAU 1555]|uniref:Polymer-forming cytoskeletal protein n=1 Tax=Thauera sedimentorum TaxID=2767595 RepID=A0ABR9BE98_9RHOO|nr:polymer-forming cytoskeletal protein [Thauera sedimentorum]MBC9073756.1 polymer-forming cytoskeletal protein [Thauera sedimentorum]MBD8504675.1 polymer-forming cytoskeletal protein [Thauera sedimentorum]
MFNKPTLFPKQPEPQTARGVRSAPANPVGSLAQASGSTTSVAKEVSTQAASAPATEEKELAKVAEGGNRLIVGPEVKLKGAEILDCDTLVVEGRVEATMDSRVIRIAENGSFSGTVGIDVAEIHGRFDGELTARKQLIVHATGRVNGKIRYGKIFIEEGGEICGDVQSLANAQDSGRPAEREPSTPRVVAAAG